MAPAAPGFAGQARSHRVTAKSVNQRLFCVSGFTREGASTGCNKSWFCYQTIALSHPRQNNHRRTSPCAPVPICHSGRPLSSAITDTTPAWLAATSVCPSALISIALMVEPR